MSATVESIEVGVSVHDAYDQWTRFEDFPEFMAGVDHVRQTDATTLHWTATMAGVTREWDARITEQIPDRQIAWTSMQGVRSDGIVTFEPTAAHRTLVTLRLDIEPDSLAETARDANGVIAASTRGDLERFRSFVEDRSTPPGRRRGTAEAGALKVTHHGVRA